MHKHRNDVETSYDSKYPLVTCNYRGRLSRSLLIFGGECKVRSGRRILLSHIE